MRSFVTIENKDWSRMYDLIVDGKDGAGIAHSITNSKKALARYVAALRILSIDPRTKWDGSKFSGEFADFGNKAIELGESFDKICDVYDSTPVPESLIQQTKEEIDATSYRANINPNFWKQLRHNNIPVSTQKKDCNTPSFDEQIKIIFYPCSYDQCSVDIAVRHSDRSYAIIGTEGNLPVPNIFIGADTYVGGYAEVFENILFNALNQTAMGGNL